VSATRYDEKAFWASAPLGQSLRRLAFDQRLVHSIAFENQTSLGEIFNLRIKSSKSDDMLMFVHDDVWIDDFFLTERVALGLDHFDVIGVAGNHRRLPRQASWAFIFTSDGKLRWDDTVNLSGRIASGTVLSGLVTHYGEVPAGCELLDGVFLAARRSTLLNAGVFFDPAFKFHFYDMDFCRAARAKNLQLGTWQVALTHQSSGDGGFGSVEWQNAYAEYLEKWKD
jgi:hypothetical protein